MAELVYSFLLNPQILISNKMCKSNFCFSFLFYKRVCFEFCLFVKDNCVPDFLNQNLLDTCQRYQQIRYCELVLTIMVHMGRAKQLLISI